jgi:hypothetical protein
VDDDRTAATLEQEAVPGVGVSPSQLLAGLLAQAFSAASRAPEMRGQRLDRLEIRVAHPVWDADRNAALRDALGRITQNALHISGHTDQPIAPEKLRGVPTGAQTGANSQDVVEPVAAALELFDNSDNAREFCAVVDVGAGTTDLALFISLTPDKKGMPRKLLPAAAPRSMYLAGDAIDEETIALILGKARGASSSDVASLRLRRRRIKETLINDGQVFELGQTVTSSELEGRPAIRGMCDELQRTFGAMMADASGRMATFVESGFHTVRALNVVFAGGGSGIGFLHRAIGRSVRIANRDIPIRIRSAARGAERLPASLERLAVALGGTTESERWPVTKYTPGRIRSLG